tara:strand:- start:16725 stop:17174 length:450 start_codon:yes stop_codon:yes gene_type:complete
MIRLCEHYRVEFHWREDPYVETVDMGILLSDVQQIMANWYSRVESWFIGSYYSSAAEDFAEEIAYASSISHLFIAGEFVVLDCRGNVIERFDGDVIRACAEISTADTLWKERRDPDYERKEAEKCEQWRRSEIRYLNSPEYELEKDIPF